MKRKSEPDVGRILQAYGDMLYRTAYLLLGNSHDVQDILQEVLLRILRKRQLSSLRITRRHGSCV